MVVESDKCAANAAPARVRGVNGFGRQSKATGQAPKAEKSGRMTHKHRRSHIATQDD